MHITDKLKGITYTILSSTIWSFCYYGMSVISKKFSAEVLVFISISIALLTVIIFFPQHISNTIKDIKKTPFLFMANTILGVLLGNIWMTKGMSTLPLSIVTMLEKLQPIFIVLFAFLFLGEKVSKKFFIWSLVATISAILISTPNFKAYEVISSGTIYTTLAAVSFALATITSKKLLLKSVDPISMSLGRFIFGSIFTGTYVFSLGLLEESKSALVAEPLIFLMIGVGTTLGFFWYYRGLKLITAGVSGFIELVGPVVNVILGVLLLSEELTLIQYFAIIMMLYSVIMLSYESPKKLN